MNAELKPDYKTVIERHFDDQFKDTTMFFLYKDKQFLKRGDYAGFARHRLKVVRKAFIGGVCFFLLFMFAGGSYFLQYTAGTGSAAVQLTVSALNFILGIGTLFYSTKEYYTIKSSMSLLLKLIKQEKKKQDEPIRVLEPN